MASAADIPSLHDGISPDSGGTGIPSLVPGAGGPATPTAAPGYEWDGELTDTVRSLAEAKSWHSAEQMAQAYNEFQKLHHTSHDRLLALPAPDAKPEEWDPIYAKLGRPAKPEGYEFQLEGLEADDPTLGWFRGIAHEHGLSTKQAAGVVGAWWKLQEASVEQAQKDYEIARQSEYAELQREWGQAYHARTAAAQRAVGQLAITAEEAETLEGALGLKRARDLLAQIGIALGEHGGAHRAPGAGGSPGGVSATPAAALEEIATMMADKEFVKRLQSGDADAQRKWTLYHDLAYPS